MPKNQNHEIRCAHAQIFFLYGAQSIRNATETYNIFFLADLLIGSKYGKLCKFTFLCNKIPVNPQKGFLQSLDRGTNKIKNDFSNSTSQKLSFVLCYRILLPPVPDISVFFGPPYYTYPGLQMGTTQMHTGILNNLFMCLNKKIQLLAVCIW